MDFSRSKWCFVGFMFQCSIQEFIQTTKKVSCENQSLKTTDFVRLLWNNTGILQIIILHLVLVSFEIPMFLLWKWPEEVIEKFFALGTGIVMGFLYFPEMNSMWHSWHHDLLKPFVSGIPSGDLLFLYSSHLQRLPGSLSYERKSLGF